MKSRDGKSKRREEERRSKKSQKKEDPGARKGRKVAIHCVFPLIWGSRGSKSRLAKAAGAEPSGGMEGEKMHAVVARSTFRSQKWKKLTVSEHFWTFGCRFAWQAQGSLHLTKNEQNVRAVSFAVSTTSTTLHYATLHHTTSTTTTALTTTSTLRSTLP